MPPARYLVTFAYLPGEASWCVCQSFAAVAKKAKDLWDVDDCALVFYITAHTGKATAIKMTTEEDFQLWYRGGDPVTGKLIVHDRQKAPKVTHSSGLVQMSHRLTLDTITLQDLGAHYYVRHSAVDEIFLVGTDELTVWGRAVQKAQRAWNVHRPLFRYVDDVHGERVVVSILDAEDFAMWNTHRRPLHPELTVYEHAAPQLLDGPVSFASGIAAETAASDDALAAEAAANAAATEKADVVRAPYRNPPELHNNQSAQQLHERATGRPGAQQSAKPPTEGDKALAALEKRLERRAEVEAAVGVSRKQQQRDAAVYGDKGDDPPHDPCDVAQ
eukprot:CAMPEP_0174829578 /NCGR_PEP_ID=MMETSP1114-20130205/2005_1 /TAXON_ID=312471 /ORGANISM="Neobodo designis, Strain CCAP 1951/1" /LENGTH=330 /DNA_ID=CAMNT_0016063331 /DNA_START=35 /DNA_END=1025 /DNA_ORIENTATION=-